MLFEFSIAKKYLIPKKKQLSLSLIALMSVGVISLVVWLVLIFLSVTDGIEKNWIRKLTALNSPVRITPTPAYYSSYYYQVDGISLQSDYTTKTIREKRLALLTDPYNFEDDPAIPTHWPDPLYEKDGSQKDLVKLAFTSIEKARNNLIAEDFEVAGALVKLQLIRPRGAPFSEIQETGEGHLTQVSYISSFQNDIPSLHQLIEPPRVEDLNHLFFLANLSAREESALFAQKIQRLLSSMTITKMKTTSHKWPALFTLLPEGKTFDALCVKKNKTYAYVVFPTEKSSSPPGQIMRKGSELIYTAPNGETSSLRSDIPIVIDDPLTLNISKVSVDDASLNALKDVQLSVHGELQGIPLSGVIPWKDIEILEANAHTHFDSYPKCPPPWPYFIQEKGKVTQAILPEVSSSEVAAVLPKNFQGNGVQIGDIGHFSFGAATVSSVQEQRLPFVVVGFYDPGVMAIGTRAILTSGASVHDINSASQTFTFDQNMVNGIQVWFDDLSQTEKVHAELVKAFDEAGILPFWNITPYYEYDFAKDLFLQFQSDKYLFTLIGAIVLIVACCNIISLLIILVNDKKKEIAIMSAMGASKRSIAIIFTLCGGMMGIFSTLIGTVAAALTLHNIDSVVNFLSFLQGHDAFNALFYGKSLPNTLSHHALTFILIATPIISLLAGLVPALKAARFAPSTTLRSD